MCVCERKKKEGGRGSVVCVRERGPRVTHVNPFGASFGFDLQYNIIAPYFALLLPEA